MAVSFTFALSLATFTTLLIILIRMIYVLYIRPYSRLQVFKNAGGVIHYSTSGVFSTFQRDQKIHKDYFHLFRTAAKSQPKHRFLAANMGSSIGLFLRDPKLIEAYLTSQAHYKRLSELKVFNSLFHNSTMVAEGAIWQAHRRTYERILTPKFIDQIIPMAFDTTLEYISYIDPAKSTLDAGSFCKTVIGEIFARMFFGKTLRNFKLENGMTLANMFSLMATGAYEAGTGFLATIFGANVVLKGYVPNHRRLISSIKLFKKFILTQAKNRKKNREQNKDQIAQEYTLLDAIFDHQRNNLETIIDAEIFDEFFTFFIAGLDTTAQVATLCIYHMAKDLEIRNTLLKEATTLFKDQAKFNLTKLNSLEYLEGLVKESMRFNPPTTFYVVREAIETHKLEDLVIPKGTRVQIGILQNQVNQDNYKDAEVFDPSRWVKGSERFSLVFEEKGNSAFCPFSFGDRKCIGDLLSKTLNKIILTCFVKRFDFRLDVRTDLALTSTPVYEPAEQVLLSIKRGSFAV